MASDYEIMMSSEVFREFCKIKKAQDLQSEQDYQLNLLQDEDDELTELDEVLEDFDEFEDIVNTHPDYKDKLLKVKRLLQDNPDIMEKTDPDFVRGIFMLSLDDDKERITHPDAMDRIQEISRKIIEE